MKLLDDYIAMRESEMDEIRARNPSAIPEIGQVLATVVFVIWAGTIGVVWWIVAQQWPPGLWPVEKFENLCALVVAVVATGVNLFIGLGYFLYVLGRINKFRATRAATEQ